MNTLFAEMPDGIAMTVALSLGEELSVLNGFAVAPWMGEYVVSATCLQVMQSCVGKLIKTGGVVFYYATPMIMQEA